MMINYKDARILGAIKGGAKTFGAIKERTGIQSDELERILEVLDSSRLVTTSSGKGLLGQSKPHLFLTQKGFETIDEYVEFLKEKWEEIIHLAAEGEREKLDQFMADHPFLVNDMLFYGIVNLPFLSRLNLRFLIEGKHLCYICKKELGRFSQKFTVDNCKKFSLKIPRGMTSHDDLCARCFDNLDNNTL